MQRHLKIHVWSPGSNACVPSTCLQWGLILLLDHIILCFSLLLLPLWWHSQHWTFLLSMVWPSSCYVTLNFQHKLHFSGWTQDAVVPIGDPNGKHKRADLRLSSEVVCWNFLFPLIDVNLNRHQMKLIPRENRILITVTNSFQFS